MTEDEQAIRELCESCKLTVDAVERNATEFIVTVRPLKNKPRTHIDCLYEKMAIREEYYSVEYSDYRNEFRFQEMK